MDVYTNSGCHNNDQSADVAMSYIDNGLLYIATITLHYVSLNLSYTDTIVLSL